MLRPGAHLNADGRTGFSLGAGCLVWTWPGLSLRCPRQALVDGSRLFLSVQWTLPCRHPLPTVRSACPWLQRGHAFEAAGCGERARPLVRVWPRSAAPGCGAGQEGQAVPGPLSAGGEALPSSVLGRYQITEDE